MVEVSFRESGHVCHLDGRNWLAWSSGDKKVAGRPL